MSLGIIHKALRSLTLDLPTATVLDHRGQVLATKNPHAFDMGTWSEAVKWAVKYFPMNTGDVVIFNDPFSGGNDFSVYSFITCLQKSQDSKAGIFLGTRVQTPLLFKDVFQPKKDLFRVPLTPIAMNGEVQTPILEAMCSAPQAPENLREIVTRQILASRHTRRRFEQIQPNLFSLKNLQSYIEETRKNTMVHLKERPWGEHKLEFTLDSGEVCKLWVEITDNGIKVDFGGTTPGKNFFLPPGAANGISNYFLAHYFEMAGYLNEGVMSTIQVSLPATSFLSAKFPQSSARGYLLGTRMVCTQLDLALQKIHPKPARGINNYCGLYVQMVFPNRAPFDIFIPNGLSAIAETEGITGLDLFGESVYFSLESTENSWPLRVLRSDVRNSVMGKGKIAGGRGLIHKFEVLEKGELYWLTELSQARMPVQKHQTSADRVEVSIEKDKKAQPQPFSGHAELNPQDVVTVASGSGGGLL